MDSINDETPAEGVPVAALVDSDVHYTATDRDSKVPSQEFIQQFDLAQELFFGDGEQPFASLPSEEEVIADEVASMSPEQAEAWLWYLHERFPALDFISQHNPRKMQRQETHRFGMARWDIWTDPKTTQGAKEFANFLTFYQRTGVTDPLLDWSWPGERELAKTFSIPRRTIHRWEEELEASGWLEVSTQGRLLGKRARRPEGKAYRLRGTKWDL